jgi:predicted RNA-binding protein with EMAP domain
MKGNETIAKILCEDYGINDLTPYEEIEYELVRFTDEISRVKIRSVSGRNFCAPVYAMFDGYHMSWYGDYGSWVFDCTWKTDISNLAYNSPYYQLEKLDSRERGEFNEEACKAALLKAIKEGDWYNYDLTEEQQERFNEFISTAYDYISYYDDVLSEYSEICEKIKDLVEATQDKYDWITAIRHNELDESNFGYIFGCEEYELYNIGNKAPIRFFIILYMLSVVDNMERSNNNAE